MRGWMIAGSLLSMSGGAVAQQHPELAAAVREFSTYCAKGTVLWGKSLCGPLLMLG